MLRGTFVACPLLLPFYRHFEACRPPDSLFRYRPTGVSGKGVGNSKNASEMHQKCVKNASKWVFFYWEKRKCVRNASKMRGTPWGGTPFGRYRLMCFCFSVFPNLPTSGKSKWGLSLGGLGPHSAICTQLSTNCVHFWAPLQEELSS